MTSCKRTFVRERAGHHEIHVIQMIMQNQRLACRTNKLETAFLVNS
jgi:hypothetical protein